MTYAFAAAGTGGHVYPALAVADALLAAGVDRNEIVFFGGDRMEATTIPSAGYRFVALDIHGLRRSLSPDNLTLPMKLRRAQHVVGRELDHSDSRVVIVFGGYVSVPAARAGVTHGVPVFLHEQNAVPGLANRLITRWAQTSFVAFPAAQRRLRNTRLVGNPLRPALLELDEAALRPEALKRYDIPEGMLVLGVLGGSLGALVLNEVTGRIAAAIDRDRVAIVHLTGPSHIDAVAAEAAASGVVWRPVAFEREMEHFYAAADVVLSRSGALTVSELAVTGTPAVVVPLAATNQGANAAYLREVGGVILVDQDDIDTLPDEVMALLSDEAMRAEVGKRAASRALPGAATEMATALMEAASG